MRISFKQLSVATAVIYGCQIAEAQQVSDVEQIEQLSPELIHSDEGLGQDSLVLESDVQVQEEEPKKKRKGFTVPLTAHIMEGENTLLKAARSEKYQRDLAYLKRLEEARQTAPKVEAKKGIFDQLKDAVLGGSSTSDSQQSFALGDSESTAPSDYYDQSLSITNIVNQFYLLPMYFGTSREVHNMVVDTAWDTVLIKSTECVLFDWEEDQATLDTCPGNLYDTDTSDNYEDFDEDVEFEFKLAATEVFIKGIEFTDDLCLINDDDLCIEDVRMLEVRENHGIPPVMEGVWGLPTGITFNPTLPPYMKYLYDEQVLTEQIFAIAFKTLGQNTFMDIGEIFDENMSDDEDIVYFTTGGIRWTTTISGLQFGENDARQFTITPKNAVFDSAAAFINVPESEWEFVVNQYVRELDYDQYSIDLETYRVTIDCNANLFYNMYVFLDGQWWAQVRAEDIVLDLSLTQSGQQCVLGIGNTTNPIWVLGLPFMRGFYAVFDQPQSRVGLVPYAGSPKVELEAGTQPTETLDLDEASNWATYGVIAAVVVVFGAYIGSVYIGG